MKERFKAMPLEPDDMVTKDTLTRCGRRQFCKLLHAEHEYRYKTFKFLNNGKRFVFWICVLNKCNLSSKFTKKSVADLI